MSPHTVSRSLFSCDRASIAQHAVILNLFWSGQRSAPKSCFPSDASDATTEPQPFHTASAEPVEPEATEGQPREAHPETTGGQPQLLWEACATEESWAGFGGG
jgi:hypothetical protein